MHYGVPGMRWGHRKAKQVPSTDGSARAAYLEAKQKRREAEGNKVIKSLEYDTAYNNARKLKNQFGKNNKNSNAELVKAAEASARADQKFKAAKKAEKAAKAAAKAEAKEVKKLYKKQYMDGASAVGKVWAALTDVHTTYANEAYRKNNGAFNPDYKW